MEKQVKTKLEEALIGINFVIAPANERDLEPHARCYVSDGEFSVSIGNPPGDRYECVDGEFFVALGTVPSDAVEYDDGDDSEIEDQENSDYIQAMMPEWIKDIMSEIS